MVTKPASGLPWQVVAESRADEFLQLARLTHRWSYAILGLGLHRGMLAATSRRQYTNDIHGLSCTVRPLFFDTDTRQVTNRRGVYAVSFESHSRNDALAQRIADAVFAGMAILDHPLTDEPPIVIRFPSQLAGKHRVCPADVLVAWHSVTSDATEFDTMQTWQRVTTTTWVWHTLVTEVWRVLPVLLSPGLFEGSQFLCASLSDFSFPGDVATEYLEVPGRRPVSFFEQVKAESAIMNAFKAIESVIGDPPKDEEKLRRKLMDVGVDPDEQMGYYDEGLRSLARVVLQLRLYRDRRAAHGSTPAPRETTFRQLHEFQGVAGGLLWAAIDSECTRRGISRTALNHLPP